jgi:hypothetical protein
MLQVVIFFNNPLNDLARLGFEEKLAFHAVKQPLSRLIIILLSHGATFRPKQYSKYESDFFILGLFFLR